MTPYGVRMGEKEWQISRVIDSAQYGDVVGSLWQVGVIGSSHLKALDGPENTKYAKTLVERYGECGILPSWDERGVIENRGVQFSSGLEVVVSNPMSGKRLSVNSCVFILSLKMPDNQRLNGHWWNVRTETRGK